MIYVRVYYILSTKYHHDTIIKKPNYIQRTMHNSSPHTQLSTSFIKLSTYANRLAPSSPPGRDVMF